MTIGFAFIAAALAVGIHEAWTKKRGVLGWIVNIVVSFVGVFVAAQLGGLLVGNNTRPRPNGSGRWRKREVLVMSVALAGGMLFSLLGAWGALQIVNRWR